jgi:hypothetical protein
VVERLPSKCEVLSSNPSTTKNINEKKKKKTADPVSTNEPGKKCETLPENNESEKGWRSGSRGRAPLSSKPSTSRKKKKK